MADTKISDLAAVTNVVGTDEYVLARAGTTKKIDAADLLVADAVAFTPAGSIAATDVQAAIEEVAVEAGASAGLFDAYAYYRDEKAANTAGGSSTSGSWLTRTLNTEVFDPAGIGTLASDQVTLAAGTYFAVAQCPFGATGNFGVKVKCRIRDVTNNVTLALSQAEVPGSASGVVDDSATAVAMGRFTLAGSAAVEVQYQTGASVATVGLGWAANFGEVEIYTTLMIYREP